MPSSWSRSTETPASSAASALAKKLVVAAAQAGRYRADGGHVYNDAVLLLPHGGQHQLYQLDGAEEIGLEQFRHRCRFPFLQGCPVTVARAVFPNGPVVTDSHRERAALYAARLPVPRFL